MSLFKLSLYSFWYACITFLATTFHQIWMGTNTQGARCDMDAWHEGLPYQWVWEGMPCMYTGDFLLGYYFYLILYLLFDIVRRKIVGTNPAIRWRLAETGIWFLFNWCVLLWLSTTAGMPFSFAMVISSFAGTILFFLPLIFISLAAKFISPRIELVLFIALLAPIITWNFIND